MNLRNKKGFITVYVMLAMMFFIVFVVTASVTASRKIKLQTEANSVLYDIYSEDIDHIVQNTTDIPIYTKEEFLQILNWLATDDSGKTTEYMYINDVVYTLDAGRYNGESSYKGNHPKHSFILKTDIWLEGRENNGDDQNDYPFIPDIHTEYQTSKGIIEKSGHNIYLQVEANMYVYDVEMIEIATAYDFLKIGTGEALSNGIPATSNLNYSIVKSIEIPDGMTRNNIPVDFSGTINGNDKIISGLKLDKSFFDTNSGTIENLTFVNVSLGEDNETTNDTETTNFGIIAGENSGTIDDCNIMLKKNYDENIQIEPNKISKIKSYRSIGGMVGKNIGTISNCNIQGIELSECMASNIGGIVGVNEGTISNINVNGKIQINSPGASTIGGICGWNYGGTIAQIEIKSNIQINSIGSYGYDVGGIVGKNSGTISKILVDGQTEEGESNFGNIAIINKTDSNDSDEDSGNIGLIAGKNCELDPTSTTGYGTIKYCIANGSIENSDSYIKKLNIGGIVGEQSGSSECSISNCYSNVYISISNSGVATSEGGIVGYLANGTIDNCAYTNQITSSSDIPIGGIVGILNTGNSPTIQSCYMNGVIPVSSKSGAVIGTISGDSGNINVDTCYNQAYRWIGYASSIPNDVNLNFNSISKTTDTLNNLTKCNTDNNNDCYCIYHTALAAFENKIETAKYAKMVIYKNRGNSNVIQLSELNFFNKSEEEPTYSSISGNYQGNDNELVGNLIDNSVDTKYCISGWNGTIKPLVIVVEFTNPINLSEFNKYSYHTANDASERDPITWNLYFKENINSDYVLYDSKVNASIPGSGEYKTETEQWEYSID